MLGVNPIRVTRRRSEMSNLLVAVKEGIPEESLVNKLGMFDFTE